MQLNANQERKSVLRVRNISLTGVVLAEIQFCLFDSRFLLHCLEDLDASLRKLNSRLFVIRGQPTDVFPRLFKV